ncbi:MAG: hypothetical protein WCI77_07160 [Candidatus Omnitrophota bacterium]
MELNKNLISLISATKTAQTNPDSDVEIHTLLCRKDIYPYLAAIKSFLAFYDNVRVIVHDDGTLTVGGKKLLREHIRGVKVINRQEADRRVKKRLSGKKQCLMYREKCPNFFQEIDYFIFSSTDKIISFDSDVLFFKYPREIVDWITGIQSVIKYNFELRAGVFPINILNPSFPFPLLAGFNSGLVCAYREIADFGLLEKCLKYIAQSKEHKDYEPWLALLSQDLMGSYVASSGMKSQALSPELYKTIVHYLRTQRRNDFRKKCIFRHYNWATLRWHDDFGYEQDIRNIINVL